MGNQQNNTNIQKFRKQDWESVQKLPEMQVWQNRKDPSYRIQQYQLYTQNEAQLRHEKKMFQLRRRSPLLVAAVYLELQPNQQFCSSHSKHLLFLERIPIRLLDIEHVPYPDYLHLFDACFKGFGQLARCAGYFLVDEGMIGINEQGMAKAWLNEDFSKSHPFAGQTTQENMVRCLIDTIQRNIDSDLLPNNVPSVRNFLYKGSDALTFDTAIFQWGEYIRKFNNNKIPTRLDCIDRVGGIYTIANRQQAYNSNYLDRTQGLYKVQNGSGFSQVSAFGYNKNQQKLMRQTSSPQFQIQHAQATFQASDIKQPQQYFSTLVKPVIPAVNKQPIQQNITSPRIPLTGIRQSNIIQNSSTINFVIPNQTKQVISPRNSQQIFFNSPRQVKKIEIPVQSPPPIILSSNQVSRSPPHATLPQPIAINFQQKLSSPPAFISPSNPPIQISQQISPRNSRMQLLTQSNHFTQQIIHKPIIIAPPQPMPQPVISRNLINAPLPQQAPFVPQISKAPKFTVEVVPGKVIPQKSSTIFKQSNVSKQANSEKQTPLLLDQYRAVFTTSDKVVPEEQIKNEIPPEQKRQLIEVKPQQKQEFKQSQIIEKQTFKQLEIIQSQKVNEKQKSPQKQSIHPQILENHEKFQQVSNNFQNKLHPVNLKQIQIKIYQQPIQQHEQANKHIVTSQIEHPSIPKNEQTFDAIQRKVIVSTSYQGKYLPVVQPLPKQQQMPTIQQNLHVGSQQQVIRQDRMSLWTAGSQQKSIDYEQMQRNLTISFNPAYDDNNKAQYTQSSNNIQKYEENHANYGINNQDSQQSIKSYQYNNNYNYKGNRYNYSGLQLQFNSIKQTGKFGYSDTSNGINQINQNSNQIYENNYFQEYQPNNYQNKVQYKQYSSDYDQNDYTNFGKYDEYSTKVAKQNYESFKFQTTPIQSVYKVQANNFQYQTVPKSRISSNYSAINQSDGKSSPDFLKKLNEMTSLDPEGPIMHHRTYQTQQTSNIYRDYLKKLTSQSHYSYQNNEIDYRNYTNTNHFGHENQYSNSSEYFKGNAQKIYLDQKQKP